MSKAKPPVDPQDDDAAAPYKQSFIEWETLEARGAPPPRVWAIDHWLGMGHTTLLAAKGGMGKSILAQQLATSIALGTPFISTIAQPRKVLAWFGEDDDDELHRRQDAICRKLKTSLGGLRGKLFFESMVDTDCILVAKSGLTGRMVRTDMLTDLHDQVKATKSEVVILDNIAMLYAGSENDRGEVSAFMKAVSWATQGAAVILIGHVAKGLNSEYSGSTAWENAVRSRWWLTDHPPDKEEPPDREAMPTDLRYLAKRKVNYSSMDLAILKYEDGCYRMESPIADGGSMMSSIRKMTGLRVVTAAMAQLHARSMYGNESSNSAQYLPKMILQYSLGEGYTKHELSQAMRSLILDGTIIRAEIGQYPNRTPRMGLIIRPA